MQTPFELVSQLSSGTQIPSDLKICLAAQSLHFPFDESTVFSVKLVFVHFGLLTQYEPDNEYPASQLPQKPLYSVLSSQKAGFFVKL